MTKVTTGLSSLKTKTPSVYDRTALGHYGVKTTETISIEGFNLGSSATITDENANTATVSSGSVAVGSLTSGKWTLSVNSVNAINNVNNNNANGSTQGTKTIKTASEEELNYFYNSKANKDNNNTLTDDFVVDVWQITAQAAKPKKGSLLEPRMKINPLTDQIGFAFVNGSDSYSMPAGSDSYRVAQYNYADYKYVSLAYDDLGNAWSTAAGLDTEPSYPIAGRFTLFSSLWSSDFSSTNNTSNFLGSGGLRIDSMGIPAGVIAQGETVAAGYPDIYRFKNPSLATSVHSDKTSVYLAYVDLIQGQIRLRVGEYDTSKTAVNDTNYNLIVGSDKKTIVYTSRNADWNNSYSSPFTAGRYLKFGDNYIEIASENNVQSGSRQNWTNTDTIVLSKEVTAGSYSTKVYNGPGKSEFGNFTDNKGYWVNGVTGNLSSSQTVGEGATGNNAWAGSRLAFELKTDNFSLIAGKDYQQGTSPNYYDTRYSAGEYVAIAVVPGATAADDVLVAVWYDGADCYYSYIKNPTKGMDMGKTAGDDGVAWATPIKIFEEGGEHCAIAVDALNGVHIVASVSGALKYVHLSTYNAYTSATYSESSHSVTVDSYDTTGQKMTIDTYVTTVNSSPRAIPVISYYMAAKSGRAKLASIAIPDSGDISYTANGVNENAEFSGAWEVKLVPNTGIVQNDNINVGLWKDISGSTKGYLKSSISTGSRNAGTSTGTAYGNGTSYAVVGYATRSGATYQIETAQMK